MKKSDVNAAITTLEMLLASKEIVVTAGSGGVGKTTTAAALGVMAASRFNAKVLVLTVDPAKRLANALGLEQFGNKETEVPQSAFVDAGVEPTGQMFAAMLDTKRHSRSTAVPEKLIAPPKPPLPAPTC